MLVDLLRSVTIFSLLYRIDCDLARQVRAKRCPDCGGALCSGIYPRKPRGSLRKIPEEYCKRMSLCCCRDGCRGRVLPPSTLFWGRRVYWRMAVLVTMALQQQRVDSYSARQIMELFEISGVTLARWFEYFREVFPQSSEWKRARGFVGSKVGNERLPGALVEYFLEQHVGSEGGLQALVQCCSLLATGGPGLSMQVDG